MRRSAAEAMLIAVCLAALLAALAIGSRWPLVGDSVLMHYVVWLTGHGFAPYRDIAEMNLPFTYMSEQAAMAVFGAGDAGWRLYDGALTIGLVLACWHLLRDRGVAPGLFAGAIFATVHLQDGIHMAGQRDLLVTVLQAAAGCLLLGVAPFASPPQKSFARLMTMAALFGVLSTAAACIKPPAVLFGIVGMAWLWFETAKTGSTARRSASLLLATFAGSCVPVLVCALYLQHFRAGSAFLHDLNGLIAYHASLERRSPGFLLSHIWSPVLVFLLLATVAAAAGWRRKWARRDTVFAMGTACGLVSYVVQGKGFPYQRYPFLLWALLLCASRLWAVLSGPGNAANGSGRPAWRSFRVATAASVLAIGSGVVLMVIFLLRSTHFSHADPYAELRRDLLAHYAAASDGRVQCLDTAGPCIGAMYESRLTESTGFLYDCYLLDGSKEVVQQQRALLEREWSQRPPQLIVLTDSNCFTGRRTFDKYTGWPWMQNTLAMYDVVLERHPQQPLRLWSRPEQQYAYRILQRRGNRTAQ